MEGELFAQTGWESTVENGVLRRRNGDPVGY
jgi:hypothetical protein